MKIAQRVVLALATLGLGGCVAPNRGSLTRAPRPRAERTLDLDAFVAEHNRNAELVQTLKAKPTIGVKGRTIAHADGRLALVRPRNFSLLLQRQGATLANIGSNEEEFWFWVQNENDKSIYWCDYTELDASALAMTYQPDWIIEALGLQPISREEAARIKVRDNKEPGTTALVFAPTRRGTESYTRMLIVSNYTLRVKELRIYAGNLQSLLAHAELSRYKDFDAGNSESGRRETCYLPESIKLEWKREQLALEVLLQDVAVNQLDPSRVAAIFVEPVIPGYERVNLAELSRAQQQDGRTTVRRTVPPPEPGSRTGTERPVPVPEGTSEVPDLGTTMGQNGRAGPNATPGRTASRDESAPITQPGGLGRSSSFGEVAGPAQNASSTLNYAARKPNQLEDLVVAPLPLGPESRAMQAANAAWSAFDTSPIGR
jgi:hypothetical protein